MRVLLAIDHSPQSWAAVRSVAGRPWPDGSVAGVLSVVVGMPPSAAELWADSGGDLRQLRENRREESRRLVEGAAAVLGASGIRTETFVTVGDPARRIVELAREWRADRIVLAPCWRTFFDRWFAGSVSSAVVTRVACSVELYREADSEASGKRRQGRLHRS